MLIINMSGGLGNQMFQYALYKVMKIKYKNVKVGLTYYDNYNIHNGFELERIFKLNMKHATYKEQYTSLMNAYISEKERFKFDDRILKKSTGFLEGNWINQKYFYEFKEEILKDFIFHIDDDKNRELSNCMLKENSVSIHIRRGDYLNSENRELFGNITTLDYYKTAIDIIKTKIETPIFYIFSDDLEWVKKNIKLDNAVYIDFNRGEESYKDMFLMSRCKHNIIANSTFSWWGAWLNTNPNKIVIRPERMVNISNLSEENPFPEDWILCKDTAENVKLISRNYNENFLDRKLKIRLLSSLFTKNHFKELHSFCDIEDEIVYYYLFRVGIVEKNFEKVEYYYKKFIINTKRDSNNDFFISAIFHFGEFNYLYKKYDKAQEIFKYLYNITNGGHVKAKQYLNKICTL